jgi:cation-transporting ATPase E
MAAREFGTMKETPTLGLSSAEVADRIARGLVNRVRRSDLADYLDIVARNVLTLFNALVVPAAISLYLLNDYRAALAVSGMAVTNMLLGLVQEVRAKRHLDRLALLAETRVRVVRDGKVIELPAGEVVQDDLVLLAVGESVVADGTLTDARYLEVDEALLTGESDPVPRRAGEQVLSGSYCVAGEGSYRAERVGARAFAQRTAAEARSYRYTTSPIQVSINRLILILTLTAITLCLGYVGLYFVRGFSEADLARMSAATITSMVPQGLVLMTTLAFILGAVRLSARGALVQRLNAVESMAAVDTLCMDKTGTLTTNHLKLDRLRLLGGTEEDARRKLRWFASASIDRGNKNIAALRAALGEADVEALDQLPFKSQNRYSAVRVRAEGAEHVLALGAWEALRPFLDIRGIGAAEAVWGELVRTGLRVLLFAEGWGPATFAGALTGFSLRPLAFVALSDEVRPEAKAVLESLAAQGIGFKIISGDNAETVRATVASLGESAAPALRSLAESPVVSGTDLEHAADPKELIRTRHVFGRVSPWQKVEIVATLKEQGRHVAMIGDGVNDILPIKNAHLGIAMGEGSPAAKTVAGLVLETNDFALLPTTLDEGRTIICNLRRAGKLFLAKNVYMLLLIIALIVAAPRVFDLRFPFLPQQVTLLNFLTIGAPAFLIMLSRHRGPTASRGSFVAEVGWFALRTGLIIGLAGLLVLWISARFGHEEKTQQTLLLTTVVLLGLTTILRALLDGGVRLAKEDRLLAAWVVVAVPLYLTALHWPLAADFFQLTPLAPSEWGFVASVVVPASLLGWISDWKGVGRSTP